MISEYIVDPLNGKKKKMLKGVTLKLSTYKHEGRPANWKVGRSGSPAGARLGLVGAVKSRKAGGI